MSVFSYFFKAKDIVYDAQGTLTGRLKCHHCLDQGCLYEDEDLVVECEPGVITCQKVHASECLLKKGCAENSVPETERERVEC